MTMFDFAERLSGREYCNEITPFEEQRAKELGFVVVFGFVGGFFFVVCLVSFRFCLFLPFSYGECLRIGDVGILDS